MKSNGKYKWKCAVSGCAAMLLLGISFFSAADLHISAATSASDLNVAEDASSFIQEFENPTVQSGSSIRYWLMNANISAEEINEELSSIANAGFSSIEVTWVQNFDSDNYNTNDYGWGSEKWMETLENILKAAEENNLAVDILYSNRWPAGVPFENDDYASMTNEEITAALDQDYSSKQLSYSSHILGEADFTQNQDGTYSFSGDVPVATALSYGESEVKFTLHPVAFTVAKTVSVEELENEAVPQESPQEETVKSEIAYLDEASLQIVTSEDKTGVDWVITEEEMQEIKNGEWTLFGFYWQVTGQTNKKEDIIYTGVIDHYSIQGSNALIQYWESMLTDEAKDLLVKVGGDFFEDSLELAANVTVDSTDSRTGTFIPWTEDTDLGVDSLSEFQDRTGYDLTPYLPLMIGSYGANVEINEDGSKVYYDFEDNTGNVITDEYKRVMSDLMMENHMDVMTEWAESLGMNFRAQAFITTNDEGGIDFIDAATHVGTIEGETLAFDEAFAAGGYDSFRYLSGGAHISGKQIISDELGAVFGGYINSQTAVELVDIINRNVAGGANQFVLHGYPEKYEFVNTAANKWPGWSPFDESSNYTGVYEAWGERNPVWENFSVIGDYMSRTQLLMQDGTAKKDLVFYYDELTVKNTTFNQNDGNVLSRAGYDYEFLSPRVLDQEEAYVENGILAPETSSYKAMIFYNQENLSLETLEILQGYADDGFPLIFIGKLPDKATTYADYDTKCEKLQVGLSELLEKNCVYQIASEDELVDLLKEIGIYPSANYREESDLVTLHRQAEEIDFYWMYNRGEEIENLTIDFDGEGTPYELDLWTGEIKAITDYEVNNGKVSIPAIIEAGDAKAVMITPSNLDGIEADQIKEAAAEPGEGSISLKNCAWTLEIESWTKDESDPKELSTVKTNLSPLVLNELTGWSDINGLEIVSGNAVYTTSFQYDSEVSGDEVIHLSLAEGTVAVTDLSLNGNSISVNQKTGKAEIGNYLKTGENQISISIATGLSNARMQEATREYGLTDVQILY